MINIPNAIIKDIASYVVIDTTSPLYMPKACVRMGGYHLVHDYSCDNYILFSILRQFLLANQVLLNSSTNSLREAELTS